jgi:hypothetical protein
MSIEDVRRAQQATQKEVDERKARAQDAVGEDKRTGLVSSKGEEQEDLGNPINPSPLSSGLVFTDNPEQNAAAYPGEPETPGANPAHTSEGLKQMQGKEPYAPVEEQDAKKKKGEIPSAFSSSPHKK